MLAPLLGAGMVGTQRKEEGGKTTTLPILDGRVSITAFLSRNSNCVSV